MTLRHSLLGVVLVVALFGGACSSNDDLGEMEVEALGGEVTVHRGNEVIKVTDTHDLQPQDVVVVKGRDGVARLKLEDDREVSLKGNAQVRIRSTSAIEGQNGSLLADAGDDMKVQFDDVSASFSDGMFRLDRGLGASRAASYTAHVTLSAPGEGRIEMDPLYEVDVAAGDLPGTASPYELDTEDAWDELYLAEVVELTEGLDRLATGFSRQLGESRPSLDYFANLAGTTKVGFVRAFLRRPPADLLVGFTIAANDTNRSLKRSFNKAFDLYDAGARWGVAATILEVRATPLLAQLSDLILGTQVLAGGGGGNADFVIAASGAASSSSSSGGGGDEPVITGGTGGNGDGNGNGGGGNGGESDDCADFASCTVEDIEDELPPGPNTEPEPEPSPTSRDLDILDPPDGKVIKGV